MNEEPIMHFILTMPIHVAMCLPHKDYWSHNSIRFGRRHQIPYDVFGQFMGRAVSLYSDGSGRLLFLPKHETLLVGEDLFCNLSRGKSVFVISGVDNLTLEAIDALPANDPIFVRLQPFGITEAKKLSEMYPTASLFIVCDSLESFGFQRVNEAKRTLKNSDESFKCFTAELTGVGKKPQKQIEPARRLLMNDLSGGAEENKNAFVRPKWANIKASLKRDGLNPLFAITFILLGLATELGYFFLGEDSSASFRVACIVMASIFPFMCCVPMGFLYQDRGCKKPTDSLFFMSALVVVSLLGFLCPIICLAIGNRFAWNGNDLILFSCLGLSSLFWIFISIALNPLVSKLFKKQA